MQRLPWLLACMLSPSVAWAAPCLDGSAANGKRCPSAAADAQPAPAAPIAYMANGIGAVATTIDAAIRQNSVSEWQFASPGQQADARSFSGSIDQSAAINAWIAACIAQKMNCYLPAGRYKASSAQILIDMGSIPSNGITIWGDNTATTIIDLTGNPGSPPFILQASGGTVANPASLVYPGIKGISFVGNYAGPLIEIGKPDLTDAVNQAQFNISIQNFDTTSASTCAQFNQVLSSTAYMNCSTAAGPNGGNDAWRFVQVQFGHFVMGASNAGNFLHLTGGFIVGNGFFTIDCEVVLNCVKIDSRTAVDNTFYSGAWSYFGNGVVATNGSDNAAFYPSVNATVANFFGAGSERYFAVWNGTTIAPLNSPALTGTPSIDGTPGATCTGPPTPGFATAGGLITHC